jgi:hypothetical protein
MRRKMRTAPLIKSEYITQLRLARQLCMLTYIFSSSDGAGRSGTYIAISNLVDRVKVVQVIDVFQCIKLIRTKRPQFVETAVSYDI